MDKSVSGTFSEGRNTNRRRAQIGMAVMLVALGYCLGSISFESNLLLRITSCPTAIDGKSTKLHSTPGTGQPTESCNAALDPDGRYKYLREIFGIQKLSTSEAASLQGTGGLNETMGSEASVPTGNFYNQHVRKCGGGLSQFFKNTSARGIFNELFEFPPSCLDHEAASRTFFLAAIRHPVDRWISEFHYTTLTYNNSPLKRFGRKWHVNRTEEEVLEGVKNWTAANDTTCHGVFCFRGNHFTRVFSGCSKECNAYQPPNVTGKQLYNRFAACKGRWHSLYAPPEYPMTEQNLQQAIATLKRFDAVIPLNMAPRKETVQLLRFMGLNITADYRAAHLHKTKKSWSIGDYPSVRKHIESLVELDLRLYKEMETLWEEKMRLVATHCTPDERRISFNSQWMGL